MISKQTARLRRARRGRSLIKRLATARLTVHRTPRHIYAQVITPDGRVLATASTLDKQLAKECGGTGNVAAAQTVGKTIAERALQAGVKKVSFDRSGFQYHGRIKALAEAAREVGIEF